MKRILLLEHPRTPGEDRQNDIANTTLSSCLNSGYLAAVLLEKGYQPAIVEGYMENLSYEALEASIDAHKPEVLGSKISDQPCDRIRLLPHFCL